MSNKEKLEKISKKEKKLQKKIDKKYPFAEIYRKAEQQFLFSIHERMNIQEDPDIAKDPIIRDSALFMEGVKASTMLHLMNAMEEQNGFTIGGQNGEYTVGSKHPYNPEEQLYLHDDFEDPPLPGTEVVVEMTPISVMEEGQEYILMPTVVGRILSDDSDKTEEETPTIFPDHSPLSRK